MTDTEKKLVLEAVKSAAFEMELAGLDRDHELKSDTQEIKTLMLCVYQKKEGRFGALWNLALKLLPEDKTDVWNARGEGFAEGVKAWKMRTAVLLVIKEVKHGKA